MAKGEKRCKMNMHGMVRIHAHSTYQVDFISKPEDDLNMNWPIETLIKREIILIPKYRSVIVLWAQFFLLLYI